MSDADATKAREFIPAVAAFYGGLGVVAVIWVWLRGIPLHRVWATTPDASLPAQILAGLGVGLATVVLGRVADRWIPAVRRLSDELRELVPRLSIPQIVAVAFFSSVGEELFFRGAMQDAWGFWITAFLFAVVHGFFERRFWLWMLFAGVMGLVFGGLARRFGTIVAPTVAHFTINAINLHLLVRSGGSK